MRIFLLVLSIVFSMSVYASHEIEIEAEADARADAEVEIDFHPHINSDTTINSNTKIDAEPAYAPAQSFDVSNQTCLAGVGGSLGVGGVFSGGYAGTHEDEQCTYRANLNHITALFGREIARAYAREHLVGLDKILNGHKVGQFDEVVSTKPPFTAGMM